MIRQAAVLFCLLGAGQAAAIDLTLPVGSRQISDRDSRFDSYAVPVAPWDLGQVQTVMLEGRVERQSWRVDSAAITTLQLLDPLRRQMAEAGFEIVFECVDADCGGFDFRFAIEVIPAPDMYVDIRDYRFVAARRGDEAVSVIVSRSRTAGYVQMIQVSPVETPVLDVTATAGGPAPAPEESRDLARALVDLGHITLAELDFATGTADLSLAQYDSLQQLAAFMAANPNAIIAIVGHTDAVGGLDSNIALSKRRAEEVRARLIAAYGIDPARIQAEGMGYLAPRATNLTSQGRDQNRRVEAILLSLE